MVFFLSMFSKTFLLTRLIIKILSCNLTKSEKSILAREKRERKSFASFSSSGGTTNFLRHSFVAVIFETNVFLFLFLFLLLFLFLASGESDLPDADQVVGVACEEGLSVCGPGEGRARRSLGLGRRGEDFGLEFVHDDFTFQIPDLDRSAGGGAEPVSVGREGEGVDGVAAVEGVEVLSLVEIPQHRLAVFAARRAQRTVFSLQLVRFHTLTSLSQPADTMMGLVLV